MAADERGLFDWSNVACGSYAQKPLPRSGAESDGHGSEALPSRDLKGADSLEMEMRE